jgi:ATP-dependent DNA ligase
VPRWENQSRVIAAPGFIEPCLPTDSIRVPAGPEWLHEIKHDGYRLAVRKSSGKARIYTRRGADSVRQQIKFFAHLVQHSMHDSRFLGTPRNVRTPRH